jgi:cyclophilin family peptidyl-prolyl cis-trans isomerase
MTDFRARLSSLFMVPALICLVIALAACGEDSASVDPTEPPVNTATSEPEPTTAETGATESESAAAPTQETGEIMQWENPPEMQLEEGTDYRARLSTNKGEIVVDLFEAEAPKTVNNFVFLAEQGYYSNVPFHRVLEGFVIQSGDPTGTGRGGPGYQFEDEPVTRDYTRGTLAMANAGPNTNGSQFFITLQDLSGRLPKNYTIFGEVVEGMDAVDAIASVPVEAGASGETSSPTEPVFIESVEIVTS